VLSIVLVHFLARVSMLFDIDCALIVRPHTAPVYIQLIPLQYVGLLLILILIVIIPLQFFQVASAREHYGRKAPCGFGAVE